MSSVIVTHAPSLKHARICIPYPDFVAAVWA